MKKASTAHFFTAAVAVLASGCVAGAIDPGDPVDYALSCGGTSSSPAQVAAQQPPGPLVLGAVVPGLTDTPTGGNAGVYGAYVPVAVDPAMPILGPTMQRTIYLNREGATLTAGLDDAAHNVSSVLGSGPPRATIPRANFSDSDWLQVVACIRDEFYRFNVQVVQERPAASGYIMAMIGGKASDLGLPQGVGGIAPIDKQGCRVIESAVVYAFSDSVGNGVTVTCEVAAQEIGHAFSLDHELLASDPMTYLQYGSHKVFQDMDADCGESTPRPCSCNRPNQNSVKILAEKAGLFQDPDGPAIEITGPKDGAQLAPGDLPITVHAASAKGVKRVTLHYRDGSSFIVAQCAGSSVECTRSGDNYTFHVKNANGLATFFAEAVDKVGKSNVSHTNTVALGSTAAPGGTIRINVTVDLTSLPARGPAVVNAAVTSSAGTISAVTLDWTDPRGVTAQVPMCPSAMGTWTHSEQIAPLGGVRNFLVAATDSAGNHAASARFALIVDF